METEQTINNTKDQENTEVSQSPVEQYSTEAPSPEIFRLKNRQGDEVFLQSSRLDITQLAGLWVNLMNENKQEFQEFFSNGNKSTTNNLTK